VGEEGWPAGGGDLFRLRFTQFDESFAIEGMKGKEIGFFG